MLDVSGTADRDKMLSGLREIEKLNANEERLRESNATPGELENRISISGKNANAKLTKSKKRTIGNIEKNTALRNRLQ